MDSDDTRSAAQEVLEFEHMTEDELEVPEKNQSDFIRDLNKVRDIKGCPKGDNEDLVRNSLPPQYTPFPNPFLQEFCSNAPVPDHEANHVTRPPLALDVTHVRSGPVYNAHSYPTKVPPEAIARYILHYTEPGDLVLDGFCGTGMTGVAAQMCATPPNSLKELVDTSGSPVTWGLRRAILADISPYATFIAANSNLPISAESFKRSAEEMLSDADAELGWVYRTPNSNSGETQYMIWTEVIICPNCSKDFEFWSVGVDLELGKIRENFDCPHCHVKLRKAEVSRKIESFFDPILGHTISRIARRPALVNYEVDGKRFERTACPEDLEVVRRIETGHSWGRVPVYEMMFKKIPWGDLFRAGYHEGITHVHHFYFPRSLFVLGRLWELCEQAPKKEMELALKFLVSSYNVSHSTLMTRIIFKQGSNKPVLTGYQTGALYISSIPVEKNVLAGIRRSKLPQILKSFRSFPRCRGAVLITTESSSALRLPQDSVDYIFVDPPFGENIKYSEGNFIGESWLRCFTSTEMEAIVSEAQHKDSSQYQGLMEGCFGRMFRALKPGKWMTVIFHNSQNRIWNLIQQAILRSGFVVANVSTLDKGQGTLKQITSAGAVKQDLVISAYKPNGGLEERFRLEAGTEEGVWDFVRSHLRQLPVFIARAGKAEVIAERQDYLLFDRMVAFHVQRGVSVPLSAGEFYAGLSQRFIPRDGMFFLSEQAAEYDRKRMSVKEILQLDLFVKDEATAIQWLRQQLFMKPQTFQELHPQFMKELGGWDKHEKPLELSELLDQNFLRYDGKGEVPSQIHSYLSTNFKDLRNLSKDDPALRAKAKDRYYVADPNKLADLEKLRERSLLREFDEYRESKQKRLKVFRLEAVRAGFKKAWQERDYATIIEVGKKIPENVLQEDSKLLMWYDQALTRTGGIA